MNAQIPLPSFEDIRKLLEFWIDQQDKWFYFETGATQTGLTGGQVSNGYADYEVQTFHYSQSRIVGKIQDVVSYPPSLLLQDVMIFTVNILSTLQIPDRENAAKPNEFDLGISPMQIPARENASEKPNEFEFGVVFSQMQKTKMMNVEKRKKYGLVFSQITYYEPIDNAQRFIKSDLRVKR